MWKIAEPAFTRHQRVEYLMHRQVSPVKVRREVTGDVVIRVITLDLMLREVAAEKLSESLSRRGRSTTGGGRNLPVDR
jgi:hypothetical protein